MAPRAQPHKTKMPVKRERATNGEALDQGEAGAIDDAERLIGPFLRDLATAPKILCRDAHDGDDASTETIPEPHGRPASEPSPEQKPRLDDDMITGLKVFAPDTRLEDSNSRSVMGISEIGQRKEGARVDEEVIHETLRPALRRVVRTYRPAQRCRGR